MVISSGPYKPLDYPWPMAHIPQHINSHILATLSFIIHLYLTNCILSYGKGYTASLLYKLR